MTHTILLVPQYWARRASSFLVAAAASLPASAFAVDLAVPPPAFTWTGFYLGANAGGVLSPGNPAFKSQGFGSSAFDLPANGDGAKAGFTGGFQAGYDYQIGSIVPGFETDFNYLSNCRNGTFAAPPVYAPFGIASYSLSGGCSYYFGTLRARLGYAFDRVLLYATAGIAYGRDPGSVNLTPAFGNYFAGSWSNSARTKYVFGVGLEYALSDHWFAKAEYLYADLGRIDQFFLNGAGQGYTSSQFNQNHIFRLGLDYKFDAGASSAEPQAAGSGEATPAAEQYSAHGQVTWVPQGYPGFHAAYSGPESLPPQAHVAQNFGTDAFLGVRLGKVRRSISIRKSTRASASAIRSASRGFRTPSPIKSAKANPTYVTDAISSARRSVSAGEPSKSRLEQISWPDRWTPTA